MEAAYSRAGRYRSQRLGLPPAEGAGQRNIGVPDGQGSIDTRRTPADGGLARNVYRTILTAQCGILTHIVRLHLATLVEEYRRHGMQPAVVVHRGIRRQIFTYRDLANLSERFAAELMRRQIAAGERVVLWGNNSAEWIAAFFGCVLRGVLVVPLDASGGPEFAQRVIAETRPRLLVGDRALLSRTATHRDVPRIVLEEFAAAPAHAALASSVAGAGPGA